MFAALKQLAAFQGSVFGGHLSVCFMEEIEGLVNPGDHLSEGLSDTYAWPMPLQQMDHWLPSANFGVPVTVPCQQEKSWISS